MVSDMSEPTDLEKLDTILTFFKEAFCIDGDAEFVKRKPCLTASMR